MLLMVMLMMLIMMMMIVMQVQCQIANQCLLIVNEEELGENDEEH